MSRNPKISNKILKILGQHKVYSEEKLHEEASGTQEAVDNAQKQVEKAPLVGKYAISRSLKNLQESGLIERLTSEQMDYFRLTSEGRHKLQNMVLDSDTALVNLNWDGFWRMVILDLPESRKSEREALRYLLKKAGFVCIKNSVWVTPHPFEHLFINIKKDLGLSTELMIIVTANIDPETESELLKAFGK
ncbi:MAG: hypothetical protein KBC98_02205 [Candidatus Pacebacteria bacterium]|nr:hypothetical protein [Candidatus Paceibacterota bacterium]